jgi:hypothetical protein
MASSSIFDTHGQPVNTEHRAGRARRNDTGAAFFARSRPQAAPKFVARLAHSGQICARARNKPRARRESSKSLPTLANYFCVKMPFSCAAHFSFETAI